MFREQHFKTSIQNLDDIKLPLETCQGLKNRSSFLQSRQFVVSPNTEGLNISLDKAMDLENIKMMKKATVNFLRSCLDEPFDMDKGFMDQKLYQFISYNQKQHQNDIYSVISNNELLSLQQKKLMLQNIKEQQDLKGLLKEVYYQFGYDITAELFYVTYKLMESKLIKFQKQIRAKQPIIQQFECFLDFETQIVNQNGCCVYEEIEKEEVEVFSKQDLTEITESLYFSKKLKYLNLKEIQKQKKKGVNILIEFQKMIEKISTSLFFTLSGLTDFSFCQNQSQNSMEAQEFSQGILSMKHSFSKLRSFGQDQEFEDLEVVSKKIKFDE